MVLVLPIGITKINNYGAITVVQYFTSGACRSHLNSLCDL